MFLSICFCLARNYQRQDGEVALELGDHRSDRTGGRAWFWSSETKSTDSSPGAALPARAAWGRTWLQGLQTAQRPWYSLFKVIDWGLAALSPNPISLWRVC